MGAPSWEAGPGHPHAHAAAMGCEWGSGGSVESEPVSRIALREESFLPHCLSCPQDLKPVIDGMDGIKISQGLGLQDFDLIRVIGRGSYAKVLLVRLKKNDQMYAMKVVKKELVHDDEVSTDPGLRFLLGPSSCPPVLLSLSGSKRHVTELAILTVLKDMFVWCLVQSRCDTSSPLSRAGTLSSPRRRKPCVHEHSPPRPTAHPRHTCLPSVSGLSFPRHFLHVESYALWPFVSSSLQ